MRKEFYKINPYIPLKLLHLTVHDAVLHAYENTNTKPYENTIEPRINRFSWNVPDIDVSRTPYNNSRYPMYLSLVNNGRILYKNKPHTQSMPSEYISLNY